MAEGVEEGYTAVYSAEGSSPVVVYAVRLNAVERPRSSRGRTNGSDRAARLAIGRVLIAVTGPNGRCFDAIEAHLRSLAR
jgi:hypothetical protein